MSSAEQPPTPGKDEFANLMLAAVRAAGDTSPIRYDAEEFRLLTEGDERQIFNLTNIYREYCGAAADKQKTLLRNAVRSWFSRLKGVPDSFEDAAPDLLPVVRNRSAFEFVRLRTQIEDMGTPNWPYRPLAEHLGVGLVFDLPESIVQIQQHQFDEWGVSFDEAFERAWRNLWEVSLDEFDSPRPGVWASPWRDNHDVARLLLPDLLKHHAVKGEPIVMLPNRDTLLLTGSEDAEGLAYLAERVSEAMDQPRFLIGVAFRLADDFLEPYLPAANHAQFQALHLSRVRSLSRDYDEQQQLLNALHEKTGEDVFVASYSALQNRETGRLHSYCVWSEDVDSLLPQTDRVYFVRQTASEKAEMICGADWEKVCEVVGGLMTPRSVYPERYFVKEFPTKEQLEELTESEPEA
jgi:hypothetical protein